jgi:hypothetical protein
VTSLNPPIFAIFAVLLGSDRLVVEPKAIAALLETKRLKIPDRIFVLPWVSENGSEEEEEDEGESREEEKRGIEERRGEKRERRGRGGEKA